MPRSAHVARSRARSRPHTFARGGPSCPAPLTWLARALARAALRDFVLQTLTRSLAGAPHAPLRSRGSLARSLAPPFRDFVPQTPDTFARGGPSCPAPLTWLARAARSRRTSGLRPPDPLTRSLAGAPHAPLRSRGSLARSLRTLGLGENRRGIGRSRSRCSGGAAGSSRAVRWPRTPKAASFGVLAQLRAPATVPPPARPTRDPRRLDARRPRTGTRPDPGR